jgi:hypothetical protein
LPTWITIGSSSARCAAERSPSEARSRPRRRWDHTPCWDPTASPSWRDHCASVLIALEPGRSGNRRTPCAEGFDRLGSPSWRIAVERGCRGHISGNTPGSSAREKTCSRSTTTRDAQLAPRPDRGTMITSSVYRLAKTSTATCTGKTASLPRSFFSNARNRREHPVPRHGPQMASCFAPGPCVMNCLVT